MRKLSWFNKLLFVINSLVAFALLFTNLIPYISPKSFPQLAVLSLAIPFLIGINVLFAIYWILKLKKHFFLSTLVLFIGFNQINKLYQISNKEVLLNDDLKVMSYNIHLFNIYKWKTDGKEETLKPVTNFINDKDPDIICFQEFLTDYGIDFDLKYKYIQRNDNKNIAYFGMAIFSKYKIINQGSLDFKQSANNTIFADIVKGNDTIRVYNVHLESQKLEINKDNFGEEDSEKLRQKLQLSFQKQAAQAEQIVAHEESCNYKTIITGDFNNTAFSWVYNKVKDDKNDAFVKAGKGFGKSYDYFLPARIDFIFADEQFEINNFKTYDFEYSDHFPIMARLGINKYTFKKLHQ